MLASGKNLLPRVDLKCVLAILVFMNLVDFSEGVRVACSSYNTVNDILCVEYNRLTANFTDNDSIRISCYFNPLEWTFRHWKHNGTIVKTGDEGYEMPQVVHHWSGRTIVGLKFVGAPDYEGVYECVTTFNRHDLRRAFRSVYLTYFKKISVVEDLTGPPIPGLLVGQPLRMNCTMAHQEEQIWLRVADDVRVQNSSDGRVVVEEGGALVISHLTHADSDKYFCVGTIFVNLKYNNLRALDIRRLIRDVIVKGLPAVECDSTSISVPPGQSVVVACSVVGLPAPSITWAVPDSGRVRRDLVVHQPSYYDSAWNDSLTFVPFVYVNDSGDYVLSVGNSFGNVTVRIRLNVLYTLENLLAPTLSLVNTTTVTVEWDAPTNPDSNELQISYYMVLYGVVDSNEPRSQVNASSDQRSLNVTLLPDTQYYFAMSAVNQVTLEGAALSPQSHIETKESVPSPPLDLEVGPFTPQSALVRWLPLAGPRTGSRRGKYVVLTYVVAYKLAAAEWSQAKVIVLEKSNRSAELSNLMAGTDYEVNVRGVNALGLGAPAYSGTFTTAPLILPGTPVEVTPVSSSSNQAYLCWRNGPATYHVQEYIVTLFTGNSSLRTQYRQLYVDAIAAQERHCAWTVGLDYSLCYWFAVEVVNAAGRGNQSDISLSQLCISPQTSALKEFTKPQVLVPVILSVVGLIVVVAVVLLVCIIRRSSRKSESIYVMNPIPSSPNKMAAGASGRSSKRKGSKMMLSDAVDGRDPMSSPDFEIVDPSSHTIRSTDRYLGAAPFTPISITAQSGIPYMPQQMGEGPEGFMPSRLYSGPMDETEGEVPLQWTIGPAHESRDTPPVMDRLVSIDASDSGFEYAEVGPSQHHSSLPVSAPSNNSNEDSADENEEFDYTDNVAYGKVTEAKKKTATVTLIADPNSRDKEFVIFHKKKPRLPPGNQCSS